MGQRIEDWYLIIEQSEMTDETFPRLISPILSLETLGMMRKVVKHKKEITDNA